jgi:hypothetical protein
MAIQSCIPRKFKYRIIDSKSELDFDIGNFQCNLRVGIDNIEDAKEWIRSFEGLTKVHKLICRIIG